MNTTIADNIADFQSQYADKITLVAVSKTKPIEDIKVAYDAGQRIFGENKVQELVAKQSALPKDIHWHMIGHLQRNKVKYIAPFVNLIHSVDSRRLLQEIDKQATNHNRIIDCLLQIHIAKEDSKYGLSPNQAKEIIEEPSLDHIRLRGLMAMATFTEDKQLITDEFKSLKKLFDCWKPSHPTFDVLSMGMSGDYRLAIDCGSNMVRVGSLIFGERK